MEKEIEIKIEKTLRYDVNSTEQQVVFVIPPATGETAKEIFEAFARDGNFTDNETAKITLSICEWANYPKRSYAKKLSAKYSHVVPLAQNEYLINGKVIKADETTALIDAGNGLVFSIQNGLSRKKILKNGSIILVKGTLKMIKK